VNPKYKNSGLTHARLLEALRYDLGAGRFYWNARNGKRAGYDQGSYRRITLDGVQYYEHCLAWFFVKRTWPVNRIDHVDTNKRNNSFENLREASDAQNAANRPPMKRALPKGVHQTTPGRFRARAMKDGVAYNSATVSSMQEAQEHYRRISEQLFGSFSRWTA
jgi:hypothetical protein